MPLADDRFLFELVEGPDPPYVANVFPPEGANISSTKKISKDAPSKPDEDTVVEEETIALTMVNIYLEGRTCLPGSLLAWRGLLIGSEVPTSILLVFYSAFLCSSPCLT